MADVAVLGHVRRRPMLWGAIAFAVIAVVAGVAAVRSGGSANAIPGLRTYGTPRAGHVENDVQYPQRPPVGGPHWEEWQSCGFYNGPVASEAAVHSLEHGAVWITYRRDASSDDVELLRKLSAETPYILITAYQGQRAPIVASAWGRQLAMPSARDRRLAAFLIAFRDGPQTPEVGASCEDGLH